ncbi:phosphatidylinositol 4,5-bisphosphate 5-phosphatase A [Venturia canescens]|uniref:phosphatidylinositol 4,5-bisphosphate 5-phosphatase A n=1 Tax=Venturia canescens TaxID=32260 RepID=UPI001C9D0529|nr:phosphatidylinositol 4,5-bisphosphate 5-phosphatase A-like [Venturia canescens]XP_043280050.1 phosphatidylinositol 4,5-bisphosphate 5-phosphatase A-like [Venturia canescens]XP_043280051.1 phosphatidylinositol 4,5-bisphosphate 5-phosphatase A-like [Venturia canescens]
MWFQPLLLAVLLTKAVLSHSDPGLLRVPKVYNAVITSNQNLAPSRAYPVIQPVVHRTAIGYVPPFYYTQIAPGFAGPGVVQLDPEPRPRPDDAESVETPGNAETKSAPRKSSRPSLSRSENEEFSGEDFGESSEKGSTPSSDKKTDKKNNDDRVPLNFYPNYRSVYYGPYFNPYNAFPPNLATPGTYYVNYPPQPPLLGPLPPPLPLQPGPGIVPILPERPNASPDDDNDRESPKRNTRKQKTRSSERREKIPDAPSASPPISSGKQDS